MPDSLSHNVIRIARKSPGLLGLPPEPFDNELHNRAYWVLCAVVNARRDGKDPFWQLERTFSKALSLLERSFPDPPAREPMDVDGAKLWLEKIKAVVEARKDRHPAMVYFREASLLADAQVADKARSIAPARFELADVTAGYIDVLDDASDEASAVVVLLSRPRRTGGDSRQAVIAIPAQLGKDGRLRAPSDGEPAEPHLYRSAVHAPDGTPFVELDEAAIEGLSEPIESDSWAEYLDSAIKRIERVFQAKIDEIGLLWGVDAPPLEWSCVKASDLAGSGLAAIYSELGKKETLPALLHAWLDGRAPVPASLSTLSADRHLAHMDAWSKERGSREGFALDSTQRLAAVAASSIARDESGIVIPINGPPGTGKTSFLRSVIASYWVADALSGAESPRLVVGTGATNKSVSNVIEAFSGVASPDHAAGIHARWIPAMPSYGWFMPSKNAKRSFPHLMWLEPTRDGLFHPAGAAAGFCDAFAGDPQDLVDRYLAAAARVWPEDAGTVDNAVEKLLERMRGLVSAMNTHRQTFCAGIQQIAVAHAAVREHGPGAKRKMTMELAVAASRLAEMTAELGAKQQSVSVALLAFRAWAAYAGGWRSLLSESLRRRFMPHRYITYLQAMTEAPADLSAIDWLNVARGEASQCRGHRQEIEQTHADVNARLMKIETDKQALNNALEQLGNIDPGSLRISIGVRDMLRASRDPEALARMLEAEYDRSIRFELFHLAARYWEGRWLQRHLAVAAGDEKQSVGVNSWLMLAPIVVITTKKLQHVVQNGLRPDVLILDEAGQCATHAGVFLGAYARNAVLVGDVRQLEPIFPISSQQSDQLAKQSGGYAKGMPDALCAARGSMMTVAQRASSVTDAGPQPGIELRFHYRCHPDIEGYCNQLMYGGRMINCVRVPDPDPLAGRHLLWVPVQGRPARTGASWRNEDEIDAISDWIACEAGSLCQRYDRPLDQLLAVVTPLSGQAKALRPALKKRLEGRISGDVLDGMTIGTVHALQGAERPVVAFSLVQNRAYFADNGGGRLMNVAVSRAKDAFVVFGDADVEATGSGAVAKLFRRATKLAVRDGAVVV